MIFIAASTEIIAKVINTLISRLLVVPVEAKINNANTHGELKNMQLLLSQVSVFKDIVIQKWTQL